MPICANFLEDTVYFLNWNREIFILCSLINWIAIQISKPSLPRTLVVQPADTHDHLSNLQKVIRYLIKISFGIMKTTQTTDKTSISHMDIHTKGENNRKKQEWFVDVVGDCWYIPTTHAPSLSIIKSRMWTAKQDRSLS